MRFVRRLFPTGKQWVLHCFISLVTRPDTPNDCCPLYWRWRETWAILELCVSIDQRALVKAAIKKVTEAAEREDDWSGILRLATSGTYLIIAGVVHTFLM